MKLKNFPYCIYIAWRERASERKEEKEERSLQQTNIIWDVRACMCLVVGFCTCNFRRSTLKILREIQSHSQRQTLCECVAKRIQTNTESQKKNIFFHAFQMGNMQICMVYNSWINATAMLYMLCTVRIAFIYESWVYVCAVLWCAANTMRTPRETQEWAGTSKKPEDVSFFLLCMCVRWQTEHK